MTRFCRFCRRMVSTRFDHSCFDAAALGTARHDEPTQPIRVGELAGPRDPGLLSGASTSDPDDSIDPLEVA